MRESETEQSSPTLPDTPVRWGWVLVLSAVLLAVFVGCVELLRTLFPQPHPRSYRSAGVAQLSEATRGIAVGSSHVAFGFDPGPYGGRVVSLPAGAMDYACAEPVIRRAFERAPNLRLVILEADINGLLIDAIERCKGDFYQLYALGLTIDDLPRGAYWKLRQRALESHMLYPIFFLRRLTPRALLWEEGLEIAQQRQAGDAMLKGFVPVDDVITPKNDGRVVIEYHKAEFRRDHSAANLAALQRTIEWLHAKNVALALVRFPKHPSYREHRPPEWEQRYADRLAALRQRVPADSFVVWDYDALELPDDHFMDAHHLNRRGASALAEIIRPKVEALMSVSGP